MSSGFGPQGRAAIQYGITCEAPVEVHLSARILQLQPAGEVVDRVDDTTVSCTPGEVALAYTTYERAFLAGGATVFATGEATTPSGDPAGRAGVGADLDLVDEATAAAALLPLLADPANTDLRAQFVSALRARLAQDDIFRVAFFRALFVG